MLEPRVGANVRSLLIDDAAGVLGVSRRTVYYRIRSGELETVKTRGGSQRVLLASVERMLQQRRSSVVQRESRA